MAAEGLHLKLVVQARVMETVTTVNERQLLYHLYADGTRPTFTIDTRYTLPQVSTLISKHSLYGGFLFPHGLFWIDSKS